MADEQKAKVSRRGALKAAGGAAVFAFGVDAFNSGGLAATPAPAPGTPPPGLPWANNAMRFQQMAFTEDNPGNYDPQFWFDFFKRTHSDVVVLSAGGSIAFYPSKVPLHNRAKYLGNTDPLGEMVKGCRAIGMKIIARVDPHALSEEAFAAHPEWAACTQDGKPRRHWAAADMYVTCQNAGFMFDFMPKVLTEITDLYKPEGFFGNRWSGSGMCWCNTCKTKFKAATGFDLPTSMSPQDPARHAYIGWNKDMRWQQYTLWDAAVKKSKKDSFFSPNGGMNDPNKVIIPFVGIDRQGRDGLEPPWVNGKYAKQARSAMGNLPVAGIFSVGVETEYRWKDSVQRDPEIEMWVHAGMAQGFRPWMTKFNGEVLDKRWVPVVEKIYNWHYKNDRYLRNTGNFARVAMVFSQQSGTYYGAGGGFTAGDNAGSASAVAEAQNGYYQALVESRIPFEMIDDRLLDDAHIGRFRTLILPNIACLSDAQCAQIRAYVQKGGRIVATSETSLYDEWGKARANFGLADLFGCDYAGKVDRHVQNSYLTPRAPHPLAVGLENATRIIGATDYVQVKARDTAASGLTLVPSYPDLPMERVFTQVKSTNVPMAYTRQVGAGRVVYFPMNIDATFWEVLHEDHLALLKNAVTWASDEGQPLTVEGPGVIDIAYWRQQNSLTAHMVNLSNAMTMKGPVRAAIALQGPITVSMALPAGAQVKSVMLLEAEKPAQFQRQGDRLVVTVPSILLHEVVAVDLA